MKQRTLNLDGLTLALNHELRAKLDYGKELKKLRKKIGAKKGVLTPLEYALLHEDVLTASKLAATHIERLQAVLADAGSTPVPILMCWRSSEKELEFRMGIALPQGLVISNGVDWKIVSPMVHCWKVGTIGSHSWVMVIGDRSGIGTGRKSIPPLHKLLEAGSNLSSDTYLAYGDEMICRRFLRDGGHGEDLKREFHGLVKIMKMLGHVPKWKPYVERYAEAKQEALEDCRVSHRRLLSLLEEAFWKGPSKPYDSFKGDASEHLVHAMVDLEQHLSTTRSRAELYDVECEERTKLELFYREFLPKLHAMRERTSA